MAGKWKYLYWAVDRAGDTVDFLLPAKRDKAADRRFLERAINLHSVPEKLTIDKSGANTAAIESLKVDAFVDILRRQNKYLNNIIEQDHRAVKRESHPTNALVQVILECSNPHWRHRDNAHDSQGPDGPARRINRVRNGPVLEPCCLKTWPAKRLFWAIPH